VAINQRGERGACSNEQKKIKESKKITKTITEKTEP
jgi:hypothetical protein